MGTSFNLHHSATKGVTLYVTTSDRHFPHDKLRKNFGLAGKSSAYLNNIIFKNIQFQTCMSELKSKKL